MAKNIVICSDGTGNRGGKTRGTNVWRIFNAVDHHNGNPEQVTYYDDGVGTQGVRWVRLLTGAFGWGLSRNIREAYAFLAMNYEPGDRIYLFGFSRGAYTVRSLAGVINRCGLITRDALLETRRRHRLSRRIVNAYRSARVVRLPKPATGAAKLKLIRKALRADRPCLYGALVRIAKVYRSIDRKRVNCLRKTLKKILRIKVPRFHKDPIPIHLIGVWDTVDAVGMPFDEMKLIDTISRHVFRRRLWGFHDRKLGPAVHHAYQALALDDERRTFHPLVWEHPNNCPGEEISTACAATCEAGGPKEQIIEQVWFAGVHANVGGGYPKDSMSLVSLDWMMGKAAACRLRFKDGIRGDYQRDADAHGRLYDSRTGWGAFYRYARRNPYELYDKKKKDKKVAYLPAIHGSVFERIERGTDFYAPKVIRENEYNKVWTDSGPYAEPQSGGGTDDASQ